MTDLPAIRPAAPADWPRIAALLAASDLVLDGAAEHVRQFVLAEEGDALLACAAVERYGDDGLLRSVAVAPGQRGRGLGVAVVRRALDDARRAGLRSVSLVTTTAEAFYPRFGFRRVPRAELPAAVFASAELGPNGPCTSAPAMRLDLGVAVRPARDEDAAAIAEIYNEGIHDRVATFETDERSADAVREWLASPRHPVLVAEDAGEVLGWVRASSHSSRPCYAGIAEFSVYVRRSARGRGVADALMRAFLPACARAGFWKVLSRIFPENAASLALCRRHGFREVGTYERHAQLDGAWRDVVIVERLLGEAGAG